MTVSTNHYIKLNAIPLTTLLTDLQDQLGIDNVLHKKTLEKRKKYT